MQSELNNGIGYNDQKDYIVLVITFKLPSQECM